LEHEWITNILWEKFNTAAQMYQLRFWKLWEHSLLSHEWGENAHHRYLKSTSVHVRHAVKSFWICFGRRQKPPHGILRLLCQYSQRPKFKYQKILHIKHAFKHKKQQLQSPNIILDYCMLYTCCIWHQKPPILKQMLRINHLLDEKLCEVILIQWFFLLFANISLQCTNITSR
jgi:hypothetical protein